MISLTVLPCAVRRATQASVRGLSPADGPGFVSLEVLAVPGRGIARSLPAPAMWRCCGAGGPGVRKSAGRRQLQLGEACVVGEPHPSRWQWELQAAVGR
jgi:hypothetical protein